MTRPVQETAHGHSGPGEGRWTTIAVAAIVGGAVLRLVWGLAIHPPYEHLTSDMLGYVERASRLAGGTELTRADAFYPPGTHMLLAIPYKLFGDDPGGMRAAALLWGALSSLTPLFAWRLAREILGPAAGAITAVLVSAYPLFWLYTGFFLSEGPALTLLLGCLWLASRARRLEGRAAVISAAAAGLLGGAAVANRTNLVLNLVVVALPMLLAARKRHRLRLIAFAGAAAAVLAGVVALNSSAAGQLTGVSENGGLNFFQSHCDARLVTVGSQTGEGSFSFGSPVPFQRSEGTNYAFPNRNPWDEGFFYRQGVNCIRADGIGHIGRLARNLLDATATTTPFPVGDTPFAKTTAEISNVGYSVLWPLIVLGGILLVGFGDARRRAGVRQSLWHMACLLPVVLVYDSEPRFRTLYDVFGLMIVAAIAVEVGDRVSRRRSTLAAAHPGDPAPPAAG